MSGLTPLLSQSDESVKTKKCTQCGEVKPLTHYYEEKGERLSAANARTVFVEDPLSITIPKKDI